MKVLLLISVVAAVALGAGQAALGANSHHAQLRTLNVVMHDPGCHWFSVHGKTTKTATVAGPIRLRNLDEAKLKVDSRTGHRFIPVGKSIVVSRGHYVVVMVGQAVDDNYLKLTVR